MREIDGLRDEIAFLREIFPGKTELCAAEIQRGLNISKRRAAALVRDNSRNGKYLTITELARARL